ncbi:MAG: DUF1636 domain-containing protein [Pseudomonadota bacterium]
MPTTTITICDTCRFSEAEKIGPDGLTGGEMLAEQVERLAEARPELEVRRVSCLMGCERHCNMAVSAPGKLTYVLGRFSPEVASAEAIIAYSELHRGSEMGRVPFKQWPDGVKGHFIARIPPV